MRRKKNSISYRDLRKMLSAVLTLCLLDDGLRPVDLESLIRLSREDARRRLLRLNPTRSKSVDLVMLGSILHRWNRHPKYLDAEARPLPIKASGHAPSIESLFRAERKSKFFQIGMCQMRDIGLVRRTKSGRYLPRSDSILLHTLTPEMVANLALSINRLVSTLLENTSTKRRSGSRLIERNALVQDLPRHRLEEFKTFSREQGAALVSTMNDWLENRREGAVKKNKRSKKATVGAGIHVFAFSE